MTEMQGILRSQQKSNDEKAAIAQADEQVNLIKFQEHHKNTHAQGGTRGNDSEEEEDDDMGGQRVGCQQ